MIGLELLEAMSFVDEKYVDEAEEEPLLRKMWGGWIRWASLAACLCFVVLGGFAYQWIQSSAPAESESVESADQVEGGTEAASATEAVSQGSQETAAQESAANPNEMACEESIGTPSLMILMEAQTEDGFFGTITAVSNTDAFTVGDRVEVVRDGSLTSDSALEERNDSKSAYRYVLTQEGRMAQIAFSSYEDEERVLYVELMPSED